MRFRNLTRAPLCAVLFVGCNKSDTTVDAPAPAADKPDAYVQAKVDALAKGDLSAVWTGLPAKHQNDVKDVVHELGAKIDADVWNKTFVVLDKLAEVLKTKKDYILGSDMLAAMSPQEKTELSQKWPQIVGIVETLADSEIKTADGLKTVDVEKFISSTGNKIFGEAVTLVEQGPSNSAADVKAMKNARVSLVKQDGDKATLKFTVENSEPKEYDFIKVDGKWVPVDFRDDYLDAGLTSAKEAVKQPLLTPEQKTQALAGLGMAEMALDNLLKAGDQGSFNTALAPLKMLAPALGGLGGPAAGMGGPVGVAPPAATGPGTLPTPGAMPTPSGTIVPPTLPLPSGSPAGAVPVLPGTTPSLPAKP